MSEIVVPVVNPIAAAWDWLIGARIYEEPVDCDGNHTGPCGMYVHTYVPPANVRVYSAKEPEVRAWIAEQK